MRWRLMDYYIEGVWTHNCSAVPDFLEVLSEIGYECLIHSCVCIYIIKFIYVCIELYIYY